MNPQLSFVANRQFWAGVAATIVVGILVAICLPNLMRTHMSLYEAKRPTYQFATRLQHAGGVAGYEDEDKFMAVRPISGRDEERKMIRTASMDMVVKSPKETSEMIRLLAEQAGGFLVSSETYGGESPSSASLTIRIPGSVISDCA